MRVDEKSLFDDLEKLCIIGIISKTENGWIVNKFKERQSPSSSTERSKAFRERERHLQYIGNENATEMQRSVAQITDTDTDNPPVGAKPRTNLLDKELHHFLKGASLLRENLTDKDLTTDFRYALADILNSVHGGHEKWLLACENLARAPDDDRRCVKSVTWLLEDRRKAINRVVTWAAKGNGKSTNKPEHAPDGWRLPQ